MGGGWGCNKPSLGWCLGLPYAHCWVGHPSLARKLPRWRAAQTTPSPLLSQTPGFSRTLIGKPTTPQRRRQSGIFFVSCNFLLTWEKVFFTRKVFFFRASARKLFFLVFLLFFGGVFVLFGIFLFFARLREFFFLFFFGADMSKTGNSRSGRWPY